MLVPKGQAYEKVVQQANQRARWDRLGGQRGTQAIVLGHAASNPKLDRQMVDAFQNVKRGR
jgi:hypothetical protein